MLTGTVGLLVWTRLPLPRLEPQAEGRPARSPGEVRDLESNSSRRLKDVQPEALLGTKVKWELPVPTRAAS